MRSEPRGLRHDRLHSSLRNLECNRKELSQPWAVGRRPDPEDNDDAVKKTTKKDPPSKNDILDERLRRSIKASTPAASPKPDPIARPAKKLTSSRIHPDNIAADSQDVTKSSKRVPRESKNPFRRVKAESQKIVQETTKNLSKSCSHAGLYEEFPERKPPRTSSDELNQSILSCSSISRDGHGVYTTELNWKNTSVDWGDDYEDELLEKVRKEEEEKEKWGRLRKANSIPGLFERKRTVE
jgi:hypothetical protein